MDNGLQKRGLFLLPTLQVGYSQDKITLEWPPNRDFWAAMVVVGKKLSSIGWSSHGRIGLDDNKVVSTARPGFWVWPPAYWTFVARQACPCKKTINPSKNKKSKQATINLALTHTVRGGASGCHERYSMGLCRHLKKKGS